MPQPQTWIIFLRAVNVSGKNSIKMALFKEILLSSGYQNVQTFIQSGNVVLDSSDTSAVLKNQIHQIIQQHFNLGVEVFVLSPSSLSEIFQQNPFAEKEPNKAFITFLSKKPTTKLTDKLAEIDHGQEIYILKNDILYYYLPEGMAKSKMNNTYFEKKLNLFATGRNSNTIKSLLEIVKTR